MVNCPLCNNSDITNLYSESEVPLFQNKIYSSEEEAKSVECGIISLDYCNSCGFIWNSQFNAELMKYDNNYKNEQSFSEMFKSHLMFVSDLISSKVDKGSQLIEIGCGKGIFLEMLLEKGHAIQGFDPAYSGSNPKISKKYFPPPDETILADIFILRPVLEHIPDPYTFLKNLYEQNDQSGCVYIEVPDFNWISKNQAFWDISYEHCNYFTKEALESMFEKPNTVSCFGGQYLALFAYLRTFNRNLGCENKENKYVDFISSINDCKEFVKKNYGLAVWGAAAKGANFVRITDPGHQYINCIIDINPDKQGYYLAKTGHRIISPDEFFEMKSLDTIIVMNENYIEEIRQMLEGWKGRVFVLGNTIKEIILV